ncbi:MAG TPA: DNA helicase RecQ [Candidatus Pullichristensenella avicola]|nr:DNA helicase RecQ [Candidatus Pullichristensenella avicola]
MDLPRKGRYRHFKGGEYEVLCVARHSETDEPLVIYRALYPCPDTPNGEGVWARPLSSWNAPAKAGETFVPRFAPLADAAPAQGPEVARSHPGTLPAPDATDSDAAPVEHAGDASSVAPAGHAGSAASAVSVEHTGDISSAVPTGHADSLAASPAEATSASRENSFASPVEHAGDASPAVSAEHAGDASSAAPMEGADAAGAGLLSAHSPAAGCAGREDAGGKGACSDAPAQAAVCAPLPFHGGASSFEPPLPEPPPEDAFAAFDPAQMHAPFSQTPPKSAAAAAAESPEAVLKRVFGYERFRTGQKEVIEAILAGRDVLGVMPTGSGKSICYQVPALALPGCALVISPLISLMKDQVAALRQAGVAAAFLNSSLSERQMDAALARVAGERYKIIYVAPERLLTPRFLHLCRTLSISLVAVDEAHCISQWGQDFRPSYLDIPEFIAALPRRPVLCAFTATATRRVREDIARLLRLRQPFSLVTGFDRPNLRFFVERPRERMAALFRVLDAHAGQSGIVYCATRKTVETVCEALRARGVAATRYHAGLSDAERRENQEDFTYDRAPVMVATNAFGMGIDKADVRFVVHYNMPKDLESYYQEAGRAGRDGDAADCVLLFGKSDVTTQRFFIDKMGEESGLDGEMLAEARRAAWERLEQMTAYCQTGKCLRAHILRYFGETAPETCGACGNCLQPEQLADASHLALPVLRCVRDINGRVGARLIRSTLLGSREQRLLAARLDRSPHYGALRGVSRRELAETIDEMIERGYLASSGGKYAVVRLGPRAQEALAGEPVLLRAHAEEAEAPAPRKRTAARQGDNADLFGVLRALRQRIAERRGVPAYMVFSDATLRYMCAMLPETPAQFLRVPGVGEAKLRNYGDEFLAAIARWKNR